MASARVSDLDPLRSSRRQLSAQGMTLEQAQAQYLLDFPPQPPMVSALEWSLIGLVVWSVITAFVGLTEFLTIDPGPGQPVMPWLVVLFGVILALCLWRLCIRVGGLVISFSRSQVVQSPRRHDIPGPVSCVSNVRTRRRGPGPLHPAVGEA